MTQAASKTQGIEYSIYTFDFPKGKNNADKWQKIETKTEMADALASAETLHKSGKYKKVEVKQKYFDKKTDRNIDVTLKVYESKAPLNATLMFFIAVLIGVLAFVVTYFLAK